ncbi:hypothetical protein [Streptomyces sp. CB01373]|nr:hypothetical protein [Streptomyces sp. CB01373]
MTTIDGSVADTSPPPKPSVASVELVDHWRGYLADPRSCLRHILD